MARYLSVQERSNYHSLEDVVGCKWSAAVVAALDQGVHRPGALERYVPGISTKILNERLRKLKAYGLITRTEFPGTVPHVEYHLTPIGKKLAALIAQLRQLDDERAASRKDEGPQKKETPLQNGERPGQQRP